MPRFVALALLTLVCALPAGASADVSDFGSDLSSPANIANNHGADTSYWNVALPSGEYLAPADGQVTIVKLKGGVLPNPRLRNTPEEDIAQIIHFQVLRDRGDGKLKVVQLSTGHLKIPVTADQDVVTRYEPVNLCVKRGDLIAFNTIGAHEYRRDPGTPGGPQGAEYQVFGRVPGSTVQWYEKDNGLNESEIIDPSPFPPMGGQELLMRTTLATGSDATDICPGGYAQHIYRGMELKEALQPSVKTRTRVARLKGFCHGENYGGCFGTLTLNATLRGVPVKLGEAKISIPNSHTEVIEVPLSTASVLAIQGEQKVVATAIADTHDNPRSDDRAKWDTVPVQSKVTTDSVTLTPDKKACVVPNVVGKSSKVAKKKLRAAGCATGKVKKKKNRKKRGKVIAQRPAPGTVLASGSRVDLTVGSS